MEPKLKKSVIHHTTQEEELVEEDRLSSLPDAILVDILSLLPLKSAVFTAVLSRRWRHLWPQTTSVTIYCHHFKNFYITVDQLFSKLTSSIIQDFTIRVPALPELGSSSVPQSLVIGSWLQRVCARKVEKIKVTSEDSGDARLVIDTLPTCIFNTRSLVLLQLGCTPRTKLDYKLPVELEMHNYKINLPNLVELHLNLYASQCGLMAKLIKCCPLLEELWLNCVYEGDSGSLSNGEGEDDYVVDISNANLKRLQLILNFAPEKTKVVVDAPKLTSLFLVGDFLTCSFVRKPVSLTKAGVFSSGLQSLLPIICNVPLLGARPSIFDDLNGGFGAETTTPWSFPNLRELELDCKRYDTNDGLSLNSFASVPARRLLLRVKTITLTARNLKNLLNLGKGLLSNAPVLESLVIQVNARSSSHVSTSIILLEEALFIKELFGYPRISSQCQIKFYGQSVKLPSAVQSVRALVRYLENKEREMMNVFAMQALAGELGSCARELRNLLDTLSPPSEL